MPEVDILVTNRNSCEAIQLCVESVRHYTRPGTYRLVVYDDASDNGIDIPYLREKQDAGWLTLVEGQKRAWHGGGLNVLVNKACVADYAVILDGDVEILRDDWLPLLKDLIVPHKGAIAAVTCHDMIARGGMSSTGAAYLAPFAEWWFGILNMNLYRDGMQVDWQPVGLCSKAEIAKLPYADSLPLDKMEWYSFDVGCKLYDKVLHDNPKDYYIVSPLPQHVKDTFRHYLQVSHHIGDENPMIVAHVNAKLGEMRAHLNKLRHE